MQQWKRWTVLMILVSLIMSALVLSSCTQEQEEKTEQQLVTVEMDPAMAEADQKVEVAEAPEEEPATVETSSATDLGYDPKYFPKGLDPHIDIYLGWREKYPEGYANLIKWGKAFLMGDEANYPPLSLDPAMYESCLIAYEGARWDAWIDFRGCRGSSFYGQGRDIARYLRSRKRSVANCLATLEVESTFGLGGSCYFGILYGNYSNTIEGYCNLLDDHGVSNDPWEQACFWNMPGYPTYQNGFCKVVKTIEGWWP